MTRPPRSKAEPHDAIRPRTAEPHDAIRSRMTERRERRAAVDDPNLVLEAAARFLETRSRSVAEVRRRLTGAGYRPELVDGAVARLLELGILDDAAFGRAWIESRDRARPRGERALRQELALKGLDRALVDELLAERREAGVGPSATGGRAGATAAERDAGGPSRAPHDVDAAAAERLLARHARALERVVDPRLRRQRAYALLARNGFDPETCASAAAAVAAGLDG